MMSSRLGSRKIVKSLEQLKKDFVSSGKILIQIVLPQSCPKQLCTNAYTKFEKDWKCSNSDTESVKSRYFVNSIKNVLTPNTKLTDINPDSHNLISMVSRAHSNRGNDICKNLPFRVKELHRKSDVLLNDSCPSVSKVKLGGAMNYCTETGKPTCNPSRHNYDDELEEGINNQILAEFNAGYAYLSMACYFGRSDVALFGTSSFFTKMYQEEIDHGLIFIKYQNMRGGIVKLRPITTVECASSCTITKSLQIALDMEKDILNKLVDLIICARKHNDINTEDMITSEFIKEQHESIAQIAGLLTRATNLGICGMSEYLFDKELSEATAHSGGKK